MRIPVVITVDTEPDNVWGDHLSTGLRNIDALPLLQELLDRFGARATLLVTHTVISSETARSVLRRLRDDCGAEIGAHLHPWDNPPYLDSGRDRRWHTFPHELSDADYARKLTRLTEDIAHAFGPPRSYRAGRYGFAASHIPMLEQLGYLVDTSVTPLCSWLGKLGVPRSEGGRAGIDFRNAPLDPYYLSPEHTDGPGSSALIEIPVTIYATRHVPDSIARLLGRLPERVQRVIWRATGLGLAWARPTGQPSGSVEKMLSALIRRGTPIVNIMFHSSELVVGGSPSTRTPEQVAGVFASLESMLTCISRLADCEFTTLSDAALQLADRGCVLRNTPPPHPSCAHATASASHPRARAAN